MEGLNLLEEEKVQTAQDQIQELIDGDFENLALVTNTDEANYVIAKIKALDEQREAVAEEAERALNTYKDKVNLYLSKQYASIDFQRDRYMDMLSPYVHDQIEGTKKKSIAFIEGTAGYRKVAPIIEHDDKALEKEVTDDKYYKTVKKLVWSEVKKDLVLKDGKVYLGDKELGSINYEEQEPKFYVK